VAGKRVLVREDLNVPMKDGHISDDSRVRAAAPTLQHLAQRGARVVVMSHLGRPKDREPDLSLKPVVADLGRRVGRAVQFAFTRKTNPTIPVLRAAWPRWATSSSTMRLPPPTARMLRSSASPPICPRMQAS